MEKSIKKSEEIRQLIITKLRENHDYDSVTPRQPYWHERDTEGCNWDLEKWSGDSKIAVNAKKYLREFVVSLRGQFDIDNS